MPIDSPFRAFRRYEYIIGKSLVIWQHKPIILILLFLEQANNFRKPSGHNPHNPAFSVPSLSLLLPRYHELHLITVKCAVYIFLTDIDVRTFVLWHHEPKPPKACAEGTHQMLCFAFTVFSTLG